MSNAPIRTIPVASNKGGSPVRSIPIAGTKRASADLTYACHDRIWTRFYPETPAGEAAYNVMAKADPEGVVAFLAPQVPGVLSQLRKAGLTVRRAAKAKPIPADDLEKFLAELEA